MNNNENVWKIQTRTSPNAWSIINVEGDLATAIATAERLTGGRFVQIED